MYHDSMPQRNYRMKRAYRRLLLMDSFHCAIKGTNKDINIA